ncbi:hypothetical protein O6H91_06G001300 [Diphasiastrum complanatum]|uniref:Uncharacterized protein n=1 Tax=Diphasiastrum complanatum TaxID=34168 RepID=A0ACC2DAJ2_DIPCM|nr:hypothetical protein O6H91_06G001300 [Diphasiastrum complanatum]
MRRTDASSSVRLIRRLCIEGKLSEALPVLEDIISRQKCPISASVFLDVLRGCFRKKDLEAGRRVKFLIIKCGFESDLLLGNHLIRLFSAGGNLSEALQQFRNLPKKDEYAWNTIISAHVKHKKGRQAIELYHEMVLSTVEPDVFTYAVVLKACASIASLGQGRVIHFHILSRGLEHDPLVGNTLVDMYCKCGRLVEARQVFSNLPKRDIVSWNAMIVGCVQHKNDVEAFQLYEQMQDEGMKPDTVTYMFMLKACGNMGALDQGRLIHINLTKSGLGKDRFAGSNLIDMYVKCGSLDEARQVFQNIPNRDIFVWTSMIAGCAEHGLGEEAFHLFQGMLSEGLKPDKIIFVSVLKAFSSIKALDWGKLIHAHILEKKLESDIYVASALVGMYARCGSIDNAHKVFLKLPQRDIVVWNTMIAGFVQQERGQDALNLFERMQKEGMKPDNFTFSSIFKACGSILALDQGKFIHKQLEESSFGFDLIVGNSLLDMYVKCGSIDEARKVFLSLHNRDVVTWTSMIGGFAQVGGHAQEAFVFFKKMQEEGFKPNKIRLSEMHLYTCMPSVGA